MKVFYPEFEAGLRYASLSLPTTDNEPLKLAFKAFLNANNHIVESHKLKMDILSYKFAKKDDKGEYVYVGEGMVIADPAKYNEAANKISQVYVDVVIPETPFDESLLGKINDEFVLDFINKYLIYSKVKSVKIPPMEPGVR